MSDYPRPAREAVFECIPCDAPVVETTTGQYVCVRCGDTRIRRVAPRSLTVERDGVCVEKRIEADGEAVSRIGYTVESTRHDVAIVGVVDRIPPGVSERDYSIVPTTEADHWGQTGSDVTYRRVVENGESIDTALVVSGTAFDREAVATRPSIEVVLPLDGESMASDVGDGDWRGAYVPASVPPNPRREVPASDTNSFHADARIRSRGTPSTEEASRGSRPSRLDRAGTVDLAGNRPGGSGRGESVARDDSLFVLAATPACNEARTIAGVVSEADEHVDAVIVVDDGSDDGTARRAAEAGATVIKHGRNRGYGAALETIFRECHRRNADCLVVLDGDGQHDPEEIPELVATHVSTGAEIVIGSRFVDGAATNLPRYRWLGILVVNLLTNVSMGVLRPRSFVTDTQSGFRLYSNLALEELARADRLGRGMDASIDILYFAHEQGYLIEEVGVTVDYGVANPSSTNPVVHGYRLVRNVQKTVERQRPLLSLGLPGLFVAAGGLGLASRTLQRYLETGTLPVGGAALAAIGTVVGLFACSTAIVLHALNYHAERRP